MLFVLCDPQLYIQMREAKAQVGKFHACKIIMCGFKIAYYKFWSFIALPGDLGYNYPLLKSLWSEIFGNLRIPVEWTHVRTNENHHNA